MSRPGDIYIGTVLLEPNRWSKPKQPSFEVSAWLDRFAADGFDGVELWEFHASLAAREEQEKLTRSPLPIRIFSGYAETVPEAAPRRAELTEWARRLGSEAIKFNVGGDPGQWDVYLDQVASWLSSVPEGIRLLCECHPGTVIETPSRARDFFDALGEGAWGIIVHPLFQAADLPEWLDRFGPKVAHAHIQARGEENRMEGLDRHRDATRVMVETLKQHDYQGTFTVEFTEGVRTPDESITSLYEHAVLDLGILRDALAGTDAT
jgi:sugar phosphate isomerase/epimerase